jgi:hypothetical protein
MEREGGLVIFLTGVMLVVVDRYRMIERNGVPSINPVVLLRCVGKGEEEEDCCFIFLIKRL